LDEIVMEWSCEMETDDNCVEFSKGVMMDDEDEEL
jgi:hypothetical protein